MVNVKSSRVCGCDVIVQANPGSCGVTVCGGAVDNFTSKNVFTSVTPVAVGNPMVEQGTVIPRVRGVIYCESVQESHSAGRRCGGRC